MPSKTNPLIPEGSVEKELRMKEIVELLRAGTKVYTLFGVPLNAKAIAKRQDQEAFRKVLVRPNSFRNEAGGKETELSYWINLYKRLISDQIETSNYNEIYKWETVQNFQNQWSDNFSVTNIVDQLRRAFGRENNNLWSGQNYFPYRMLVTFAEQDPEQVVAMLHALYQEKEPLQQRVLDFQQACAAMLQKHFPTYKHDYQDDRAVMVYLTLRYPHRYYFYKNKMFRRFCEITGYREFPGRSANNTFAKVELFLEMCTAVREELLADDELITLHKQRLPATITVVDDYHLLTQDFIYAVSTYLSDSPQEPEEEIEEQSVQNNTTTMSLNQILFGPPGTGKTYNTVNEAVKIADPDFYAANQKNRDNLKERFRELLIKDWQSPKGQIAFCTFHQSFSYEDFVEGIKPVNPVDGDTYLKYRIEDGVFKRICRAAEDYHKSAQLKTQRVISWNEDTFKKASFYKISLGNSNKEEDQAIYEYCIKNNCIALGYGGETDFTGLDEEQIIKKCKEQGKESFTEQAINRFIHYIKSGNYVLVSNGNRYVRAIGQVTGPYKYDPNTSIKFRHFRPVKWLLVDQDIPIAELYDRSLSQQTIYKLDEDGIKKEFFVNNGQLQQTEVKSEKNFVLVIDEINRGNVSSIFGELITLIERDKRAGGDEELEVTLPYSKEPFKVPGNVYIVGTMNTADRSIEALDTALRRRFSFTEKPANPDLIRTEGRSKGRMGEIDLIKMLEAINQRIEKLIDKDHKIGHAYFMEVSTIGDLKDAFENKVIPLLQEYFFGDFGKIGLVLGDSFVEQQNNQDFSFATFKGYDEDGTIADDLKNRPMFKIKDRKDWNFISIYE